MANGAGLLFFLSSRSSLLFQQRHSSKPERISPFGSLFGVLQSRELRLQLHLHPSWETPSRSSQERRIGPRGKLRGREAPASPQPAAGILLFAAAGLSLLWGGHPSACLMRGLLKSTRGPTCCGMPWRGATPIPLRDGS